MRVCGGEEGALAHVRPEVAAAAVGRTGSARLKRQSALITAGRLT